MASPPQSLTTLLARLAASGTEFLLVGGLAAVSQGAPLTTTDVDVVHRREPDNVARLLVFLERTPRGAWFSPSWRRRSGSAKADDGIGCVGPWFTRRWWGPRPSPWEPS